MGGWARARCTKAIRHARARGGGKSFQEFCFNFKHPFHFKILLHMKTITPPPTLTSAIPEKNLLWSKENTFGAAAAFIYGRLLRTNNLLM